jgi:hypothetical protein
MATDKSDLYDKLFDIYNISFIERYGTSIITTFFILSIVGVIMCYYHYLNNLQYYKDNWDNIRCNPGVMPFAGIIKNDDPEILNKNFAFCMESSSSSYMDYVMAPVNFTTGMIVSVFKEAGEGLDSLRIMGNRIRNSIMTIVEQIMGKLANVLIAIHYILVSIKDTFSKIIGIVMTSVHLVMAVFYSLISTVGAMFRLALGVLLLMTAGAALLAWNPFTFIIAIIIIIFVVISMIILMSIKGVMPKIFRLHEIGLFRPRKLKKPRCFGFNTRLKMNDGTYKNIQDIKVNDILCNNNLVTSTFILSPSSDVMYKLKNLNNVYVSGMHKMYHNGNVIDVKKHPDREKMYYKSEYWYCLNTTKGIIECDNYIFMDWDEMNNDELNKLYVKQSDIHNKYHTGFNKNTKIKMNDGKLSLIKDVKINDYLFNNIKVLGIVCINNENLKIYEHKINNSLVLANKHFWYYDNSLGKIINTDKFKSFNQTNINEKLTYNLITNEDYFIIDNEKIYDYNSLIDYYLN